MIQVSTIIPTVGRPTLKRAVESVLHQQVDDAAYEVIVVNDRGNPLAEAPWQQDPRVRIVTTQKRNRCVARNVGAAVARGRYLHFLDDDDYLLPGAWHALLAAAKRTPTAILVYGGTQFVDAQGQILGSFNLYKDGSCLVEMLAAIWIPLQASLVRSDIFFEVGGFDQTMPAAEDLDVTRRLAYIGAFVAVEAPVCAILRGEHWGSVSENHLTLECNRRGRDQMLDKRHALTALLHSAGKDSFLHGRILHAYIAGQRSNHALGHHLTATSRLLQGMLAFLRSGKHVLSGSYWQAIRENTIMHRLVENQSTKHKSVSEWLR